MKIDSGMRFLAVLAGLSLACAVAKADPIVGAGTFNASGTVYLSSTAIDFGLNALPPPGDQIASITSPNTGAFNYLGSGTQIGMTNINLASATVTSTEYNFDGAVPIFITLPSNGTGAIDLSLTTIPINTAVAVCTGTAADDVPGTECRPNALSPLILTQNPAGIMLSLSLAGDAYYAGGSPAGGTPYTDILTSQLAATDGTISGFLSNYASNGYVDTSYSETVNAVPAVAPTPEPGTLVTLCTGLLCIGLIRAKTGGGIRQSGGA